MEASNETSNPKHQAPEKSRKPRTKNQAPNTKEIPKSKLQTAARTSSLELGVCCLGLGASLVIGVWSFSRLTLHRWRATIYALRFTSHALRIFDLPFLAIRIDLAA
jgi:hypothetical protein